MGLKNFFQRFKNMGSVPNKSFQKNNTNLHQAQEASLKSFSETSKIDFKALSDSQQYNPIIYPLISLNFKISQISSL